MTRYWLAGAAAFVMMTGVAFAQGVSSSSTTSTQSTTAAPQVGSYSASEMQRSTDSNGTATDSSKTYSSGMNGSKATSSSQTTSPDGSMQSTTREKRTDSPDMDSTVSKKTSTTTIDR